MSNDKYSEQFDKRYYSPIEKHKNNKRRKVFVGNLAYNVTWQRLKDHFSQIGHVEKSTVIQSADGRSSGCGIIEFASASAVPDAIEFLSGFI